MHNKFLLFVLFIISIVLSACVSQPAPPVNIYTVSPQWDDNKAALQKPNHSKKTVLKISPIRSSEAFTSHNIVYSDKHNSRNHYIYSRWSDAPVKLLQILFQVRLEKSGQYKAVLPPGSSARSSRILECTLYDFSHHINNNGSSTAVLRIGCLLIDNNSRRVVASKELASIIPAASENAQGATSALNKAANAVATKLVHWLASQK